MFYGERYIEAYHIHDFAEKEFTHTFEDKYKIICVGQGWQQDKQFIQCINSQTKQPKYFTLTKDEMNYQLTEEKEFKHIAKSIRCGEYHQIILCQNGDCYGQGDNSHGQIGLIQCQDDVKELTLLDTSVLSVSTMPFATFLIKENDIYSTGNNKHACIGHSPLLKYIYEFTSITFGKTYQIVEILTGATYSIFINKEYNCYFLGDCDGWNHEKYLKPYRVVQAYEIIKCFTTSTTPIFIVESNVGLGIFHSTFDKPIPLSNIKQKINSNRPFIDLIILNCCSYKCQSYIVFVQLE